MNFARWANAAWVIASLTFGGAIGSLITQRWPFVLVYCVECLVALAIYEHATKRIK